MSAKDEGLIVLGEGRYGLSPIHSVDKETGEVNVAISFDAFKISAETGQKVPLEKGTPEFAIIFKSANAIRCLQHVLLDVYAMQKMLEANIRIEKHKATEEERQAKIDAALASATKPDKGKIN